MPKIDRATVQRAVRMHSKKHGDAATAAVLASYGADGELDDVQEGRLPIIHAALYGGAVNNVAAAEQLHARFAAVAQNIPPEGAPLNRLEAVQSRLASIGRRVFARRRGGRR